MGMSCNTGIWNSRMPEEVTQITVPSYLCICLNKGAILEYSVGSASVSGCPVDFEPGPGFWATGTSLGIVITGGLQHKSAWIWNGSILDFLAPMNHQR